MVDKIVLYNYHGEYLDLKEICRRENFCYSSAAHKRKRKPGLDWPKYLTPKKTAEVHIIDGQEWTIPQIAAVINKTQPAVRYRIMLYKEGKIKGYEVFQDDILNIEKPNISNRGNEEWRALGDKERTHNLKTEAGTWEKKNIPDILPLHTTYRKKENGEETPDYYHGQIRVHL